MNKLKVAVVIPCYNEEDSVASVVKEIDALPQTGYYTVTAVVINDCSKDKTAAVAAGQNCILINLPVNLGIGGAVQTGFKYALQNNFDIAIQFDGDGQHPSAQIDHLISPLLSGIADVVIGSRFLEKEGFQSTYMRRSGINYFKNLCRALIGISVTDPTSGFRAINRKTLEVVCRYYPDEYPEPEAIILYNLSGLRISEIPVIMRERQGGVSSIRSYKSVYYMIKVSLAILFIYIRLKYGKRNTL